MSENSNINTQSITKTTNDNNTTPPVNPYASLMNHVPTQPLASMKTITEVFSFNNSEKK